MSLMTTDVGHFAKGCIEKLQMLRDRERKSNNLNRNGKTEETLITEKTPV
jgi:hypothetical protein